jgi:hypothetical protein
MRGCRAGCERGDAERGKRRERDDAFAEHGVVLPWQASGPDA